MLSKMQGCENTQKKRTATLCVLLIFKMLILISKAPGSIFLFKKKKKKVLAAESLCFLRLPERMC